ncbi:hypothetical protein [Motilibacter deserti]|uniref:WD40 repeat domain-containing protein n=1 Tax=Motilibacter deserti TaxID=2714956 RepID=A0ABX0GW46_9ACTN|nr:hypothetical protein [Motilibacter deserti]NHC15139.1 hypothetical protein [Motilibacter deserti]
MPRNTVHARGQALSIGLVAWDGRVLMWREGRYVELAGAGFDPKQALRTADGVLVVGADDVVLVREDGRVDKLPGRVDFARVAPGGHSAAGLADAGGGRAQMTFWDLAHGHTHTLTWSKKGTPAISSVRADSVVLHQLEAKAGEHYFTWDVTGGGLVAVPAPQVPPLLLNHSAAQSAVSRGGVPILILPPFLDIIFSPDETYAVSLDSSASQLAIYDLTVDDPQASRSVVTLPEHACLRVPHLPTWEDAQTLLVWERPRRPPYRMLRVDLARGRIEAVPLPVDEGVLIEPLPAT